jgi:hypothetical protein
MNCPHCQRLLYSRQRKTCGYCEKKVPKEYRLSAAQIEELKAEEKAIARRHEVAKEKEEAEAKSKRGGVLPPVQFMPPF